MLFAFVAGAGTAISPCVLPVLPALLSAGATGGRRRPLAIVLGLATTFAITVAGFAEVVGGVGLGDGALRSIAVVVLAGFGVALLAPGARRPARGAAVAARALRPALGRRRLLVRASASARRSGSSTRRAPGRSSPPSSRSAPPPAGRVAIAIAYSAGSAVVLFALCSAAGGCSTACAPPGAGRRSSARSAW